ADLNDPRYKSARTETSVQLRHGPGGPGGPEEPLPKPPRPEVPPGEPDDPRLPPPDPDPFPTPGPGPLDPGLPSPISRIFPYRIGLADESAGSSKEYCELHILGAAHWSTVYLEQNIARFETNLSCW